MTDGSHPDDPISFDATLDRAWGMTRAIIESAAKAQRVGLLRRLPRLVRLDQEIMSSIEMWSADYLFPPDEEWSGGWEPQVIAPTDNHS